MTQIQVTPGSGPLVNLPPANGRALAADSRPVALSTEDKTALDLVATNQAAEAALIAAMSSKLPATLGQKAMAAALAVSIATDQTVPTTLDTNTVFASGVAMTPKFAKIAASANGNNTLIAAVVGKKIRVLSYSFVCALAVTAKFQSGTGGTDLTGPMAFGDNGGISAPFCPVGHFETAAGAMLNLFLGSAVVVSGHITYVEV